MYIQPLVGVFV